MHFSLIAVGTRMPAWIDAGYREYAKRLPAAWGLRLCEVPGEKRAKGAPTARAVEREGEKILAAVNPHARLVALERTGAAWSTEVLAKRLDGWMREGTDVALLVGGADGLARACRARAEVSWSLSKLTLPHGMVRVIVAEQIYRAWSILNHHPYHRG